MILLPHSSICFSIVFWSKSPSWVCSAMCLGRRMLISSSSLSITWFTEPTGRFSRSCSKLRSDSDGTSLTM